MSSEPSDTFDTSVSRCGCPDADPQRKDPHFYFHVSATCCR
jgi:hypothetical protein